MFDKKAEEALHIYHLLVFFCLDQESLGVILSDYTTCHIKINYLVLSFALT